MDEINVTIEDKDENGKTIERTVYHFVQNSLMICGIDKEKTFLLSNAEKFLPQEIFRIFEIWREKSNYDGDNEMMIIKYNDVRYYFINNYWD